MKEQIAKADTVLEKLKPFGAVVAGGAPRDWYRNVPAKDIDVFIAGSPSKEELEAALSVSLSNLSQEDYDGERSRFDGYSFSDEDGQEFQILCHNRDSVEDIVKDFPNNLSMAIYYGKGKFWYDEWFLIGMQFKVGWWNDDSSYKSDIYENKILEKFRTDRWEWSASKDRLFKYIGRGCVLEEGEEAMMDNF
jgi:hypothetical protein